jgi:membrane protein DedA with SNARE-associated domain
MRTSEAVVLGAIIGAVVMWLWGREMETYVAEKAGKVLDRGGEALRRADDFLQDTRAHVSEALS